MTVHVHRLFWLGALLSLCATHLQAQAPAEVSVGGRRIVIPPPVGFERADGVNPDWDKVFMALQAPQNRLLAAFATPADRKSIETTGSADFSTNFNVQVVRSVENQEIGDRTFAAARQEVKASLQEFSANIEKEINKVMTQGSKTLSRETGIDPGLSVSNTVFLGFFEETESSLGFTMAMNMKAGDAVDADSRSVAAAIMVPVNGRLLNLYATMPYAGNADRSAAEKAVTAWRDAIVAANPRVAGPAGGFDWKSVGRSGLIGGIVGGLVALIAAMVRKMKRRKQGT